MAGGEGDLQRPPPHQVEQETWEERGVGVRCPPPGGGGGGGRDMRGSSSGNNRGNLILLGESMNDCVT